MHPPIDETLAKIRLDPKAEIPLYVQLKNQLRYLIQSGHLTYGQLPTVRQLDRFRLGSDRRGFH